MDRIRSMQVFTEVADRGSFAAAARALRITGPMVGKHVTFLERRLGVRLLARTTRRQKLTEAGRAYLESCRLILRELAAAEDDARERQSQPRGTLRVAAPTTLGALYLAPRIARFLSRQPGIEIELVLNDEPPDLVEGAFDAAVRIGRPPDSNLIARPMPPYQMVICASPDYLAARGTPTDLDALAQHDCLGFTHWDRRGGWWLGRAAGAAVKLPSCRLRSNNGIALREAAIAGAGILMQPRVLVAEALAHGRLIEILTRFLRPPRPVNLLYARDRRAPARLRLFIDFMVEQSRPG